MDPKHHLIACILALSSLVSGQVHTNHQYEGNDLQQASNTNDQKWSVQFPPVSRIGLESSNSASNRKTSTISADPNNLSTNFISQDSLFDDQREFPMAASPAPAKSLASINLTDNQPWSLMTTVGDNQNLLPNTIHVYKPNTKSTETVPIGAFRIRDRVELPVDLGGSGQLSLNNHLMQSYLAFKQGQLQRSFIPPALGSSLQPKILSQAKPFSLDLKSHSIKSPTTIQPSKIINKIRPKSSKTKSLGEIYEVNDFDRSDNPFWRDTIDAQLYDPRTIQDRRSKDMEEDSQQLDNLLNPSWPGVGQYGADNMMTGSKLHHVSYQMHPGYYAPAYSQMMSHKRFGVEKSLTVPILVGIGAALISFLIISNLFLTIPLFAMTLLQLLDGGMMVMPNNNNQNSIPSSSNNNSPFNQLPSGKRRKREVQVTEPEIRLQKAIEFYQ